MPVDPASIVAVSAAVVAAEGVREFVKRISGKLGDEAGMAVAERIAEWRQRQLARALERAEELASQSGGEIKAVPPRTLVPLLSGASLEDDEELSERWAALLANAAIGEADDVPPLFATILANLTPIDGKVLEKLRQTFPAPETQGPHTGFRFPLAVEDRAKDAASLGRQLGVSKSRVDSAIDTLVSHGLATRTPITLSGETFGPIGGLAQLGADIRITELGKRFLRACDPPSKRPAKEEGPQAERRPD